MLFGTKTSLYVTFIYSGIVFPSSNGEEKKREEQQKEIIFFMVAIFNLIFNLLIILISNVLFPSKTKNNYYLMLKIRGKVVHYFILQHRKV